MLGQDAQSGALTRPWIADRQGETAFADLLFDAPAEALNRWRAPQGRSGHFG
jgi:hypothetical protein